MVKVAILHEGQKDKSLDSEILKLLLEKLELDEYKVEFFGFGAKSNFFKLENVKYKRLQQQIDEEEINKILFIIDSDYIANDSVYNGYDNTYNELMKIIRLLNLESISDIYISCEPITKNGYMESLVLSTIPKEQKQCIENFLQCNEFKSKENDKAIINQIYKSAYPNASYEFSHKNFNLLKEKLQNLFN